MEFILQYMSLPHLRRRIRQDLLKVDQLHVLARNVHYGTSIWAVVGQRPANDQAASAPSPPQLP
jgi:hypothetical protein